MATSAKKTTPFGLNRGKSRRLNTLSWKFSNLLDTAFRYSFGSTDILPIKDLFIEILKLMLDIQVLKQIDIDQIMKFEELASTSKRSYLNRSRSPSSSGRRIKSIARVSPINQHSNCQKKLDFNDDEDVYKVDADINLATCTCRISLLEKQKLALEKGLHRSDENDKTWEKKAKHYESLANEYLDKFRELKEVIIDRKTDICLSCEQKQLHINRYRAERSELKANKEMLEKFMDKLAGERNNLTHTLQKIQMENVESLENIKSLETQYQNATTNFHEAEKKIKELNETIEDQNQENQHVIEKKEKLDKENKDLEKKLRLHDNEVRLLYNSLETERHEHDTAMSRLEMQYTAMQNECVELWLKLQNIHNSSEISFEKLGSVIDKNIFKQKLEETTAQENTLAKETTKILKNFASAKDKKGCIKVLKKRFEKDLPSCGNDISSDEKTDMEDNNSNSSCKKYYEETLTESRATTICHNRMNRTTNVFNVNIASSKVSFNENTEEQLSCIDGSNGQYPAIDEGQ